jgi:hypothetical protein
MEPVWAAIKYLGDHPIAALGAVIGVVVIFYLLNLKPKAVRDADKRFETLRKDRTDHYRKQRPLR